MDIHPARDGSGAHRGIPRLDVFRTLLKYGELFEDGRYYDPVTGVVYHEENSASSIIAAVFFLGAFVLLLRVREVWQENATAASSVG